MDARNSSNGVVIQVEWDGLPDEVDFTWEPADQLLEDIPEMVKEFAVSLGTGNALGKTLNQMTNDIGHGAL